MSESTSLLPKKPSVNELARIKLRPTYVSFPSPQTGRSPVYPNMRLPQYSSILTDYANSSPSTNKSLPHTPVNGKSSSSINGSILYFINFLLGIGILALPYAIKLCGWIGILILVTIGFLMQHTARVLGVCQYQYTLDTYPGIVESAFGVTGRIFISLLFYVQLLLEATIFLLVLSNCFTMLFPLTAETSYLIGMGVFAVLSNIFIFPQVLGWCSAVGSMCTLLLSVTIVAVCVLNIAEEPSLYESSGDALHQLFAKDKAITTEDGYSVAKAIGIFIFCFMGHTIFPSVVRNMLRPSQFPTAVTATFCFLQVAYVLVSVAGYMAYADHAQSNILFNVATRHVAFKYIMNILLLVTVSTKYALASVPITESLIDWLEILLIRRMGRKKRLQSSSEEIEGDYTREQKVPYLKLTKKKEKKKPSPTSVKRRYSLSDDDLEQHLEDRSDNQRFCIDAGSPGSSEQDEKGDAVAAMHSSNKASILAASLRKYLTQKVYQHGLCDDGEGEGGDEDQDQDEEEDGGDGGGKAQRPLLKKMPVPFDRINAPAGRPQVVVRSMSSSPLFSSLSTSMNADHHDVTTMTGPNKDKTPSPLSSVEPTVLPIKKIHKCCTPFLVPRYVLIIQVAFRIILPVIAYCLTLIFRNFAHLVSFVGGFFGSLISIVFPSLCYVRMFRNELSQKELCYNYLVSLLGIALFVVTLLVNIVSEY